MLDIESLTQIPDCDKYFADRSGNIYSANKGKLKVLAQFMKKPGRPAVGIGNVSKYVHILICSTFHGPKPEGKEVRHLDGNGMNNHADNLKWGTREENLEDDRRLGTRTGFVVRRVSQEESSEIIRSSESNNALAKRFGFTVDTIRKIRKRSQELAKIA